MKCTCYLDGKLHGPTFSVYPDGSYKIQSLKKHYHYGPFLELDKLGNVLEKNYINSYLVKIRDETTNYRLTGQVEYLTAHKECGWDIEHEFMEDGTPVKKQDDDYAWKDDDSIDSAGLIDDDL